MSPKGENLNHEAKEPLLAKTLEPISENDANGQRFSEVESNPLSASQVVKQELVKEVEARKKVLGEFTLLADQ